MNREHLISLTEKGLYCSKADVYIDPWRPVEKALITHAHSDHARWGHAHYLAHPVTSALMKQRIGAGINTQSLEYEHTLLLNGVKISFHPAGHIPGSAQIRLEHDGEVWVVSGDYKLEDDGLSDGFMPVPCQHFISECTFGLPVFLWKSQLEIQKEMIEWIQHNASQGLNSLLFGYALGKIQRVLNGIRSIDRPIFAHGAVIQMNKVLESCGYDLPECKPIGSEKLPPGSVILAPPSAAGSIWMNKLKPYRTAFISGWMQLRGSRRWQSADKGFVLSDHADWAGLLTAIKESKAQNIYLTHGYKAAFAKYLTGLGYQAVELDTLFEGEHLQKTAEDNEAVE